MVNTPRTHKRGTARSALGQAGQTTTEYILLIATIASLAFTVMQQLKQMKLTALFTKPLTTDFKAAYRYGHPLAKGPDEGGFEHHPIGGGDSDVRIFFNPGKN